jgi:Ca-activated chloride channel homolog
VWGGAVVFRRSLVLAVVLASSVAVVSAQSIPPAEASQDGEPLAAGPTFRAGVDLVALTVAVTDREQRFIGDLTADDFAVFEDGVQQPISFFAVADVPLDLTLLVDTSASMTGQMEMVQRAASGLLRTLKPGDRASLVEFRDVVRVQQAMTEDIARIETGLGELRPAGGTALYNALYVALKEFERLALTGNSDVRRRAIVVLSDGDDTTSLLDFDEVLEMGRRSGVTVYTVALRSPLDRLRERGTRPHFSQSDHAMRTLARETGGRWFSADEPNELTPVYASIADEIANQYALGYTSVNPKQDGAYRRVLVRVVTRGDAWTRTRSGYFAPARPARAFWQDTRRDAGQQQASPD